MAARRFNGGKKIDRWKWRLDNGVEVHVDVYMVGTTFHAVNDKLQVDVECKTIDELKTKAKADIVAKTQVDWRKVLHVEVSMGKQGSSYHSRWHHAQLLKANLVLEVEEYWIAEIDGKQVSKREEEARATDGWPREDDHGWKKPGRYDDEEDCEPHLAVIIDDTPENRRALETIQTALLTLGDQLRALLKPDTLPTVLARIAGGAMLPPALPALAELVPPKTRKKRT